MSQEDTRGRSVFTIVSQNRVYSMLEDDDIGSIVQNLWTGSKIAYGIVEASSLYKSLEAPAASYEAH